MEKIKIEDLYCGGKYHIKNAVYEKARRRRLTRVPMAEGRGVSKNSFAKL